MAAKFVNKCKLSCPGGDNVDIVGDNDDDDDNDNEDKDDDDVDGDDDDDDGNKWKQSCAGGSVSTPSTQRREILLRRLLNQKLNYV